MTMTRLGERTRRALDHPGRPTSGQWWESYRRRVGARMVDDDDALGLTAYYRALALIGGTSATLPLHIYRKEGDTAVLDQTEETAYLWRKPNPEQGIQALWERAFADEVRQKAILFVDKLDNDQPAAIWQIDRARVRVGRASNGWKVYEIDGERIPYVDYSNGGNIVHIPNWGRGVDGYDLVNIAANAIGLGLSAEEYATQSLDNGQVPPGIISSEQALTRPQADALLAEWRRRHAGIKRGQDVAFLGNGAKFQQISVDFERMQMEKLRRFQVAEISRLTGVPLHLLGDPDHASQGGGNGMEESNLSLLRFVLMAHIRRFEDAINDNLLVTELTGRYAKFELGGLMRPALLQRYQAYAMGYGRWLTARDIRNFEEMGPVDGDELLLAQVNMIPADQLGLNQQQNPQRGGRQAPPANQDPAND